MNKSFVRVMLVIAAMSAGVGCGADEKTEVSTCTGAKCDAFNTHANEQDQLSKEFLDCQDYDEPTGPADAPQLYGVHSGDDHGPHLIAVDEVDHKIASSEILEVVVENARFTNYKCWDKNGHYSGFDPNLVAELLARNEAGYSFVRFVPIPWQNVDYQGEEQLSFFAKLNAGEGDIALAGMSINDKRLMWGDMLGPIYRAGKKLIARKDNNKIDQSKLDELMKLPMNDYDVLRGLVVVEQGSNIRGDFYRSLADANPDLVKFAEYEKDGDDNITGISNYDENSFFVIDVEDYALVTKFIDSKMTEEIYGIVPDLVMIDTGSVHPLTEEGKLGVDTHIVTSELAFDPNHGKVFGLGDGIAIKKGNMDHPAFEKALREMINDGTVNRLVKRWFNDDNAADHSWASE